MSKLLPPLQRSRRFQVGGLAAIAFTAGGLVHQASAAAVVINPSFNVTDAGGSPVPLFAGDYTSGMGSTILNPYRNNAPVTVTGWLSAAQNFTAGVENSGDTIAGDDQSTAYVALDGTFSQTLAGPTEAGVYILSLDVARRSDREFNPFTMHLRNARTGLAYPPVSSSNPIPDPGAFTVWTQIYAIPASNDSLQIEFAGTGSEKGTNIDNVSLVPEPSTAITLGLGAICVGMLRRKRRNAGS